MRSRDRLRHFQKWLEPDLACFFFGPRWEAQRHAAFFAQLRSIRNRGLNAPGNRSCAEKAPSCASLCRRSPKCAYPDPATHSSDKIGDVCKIVWTVCSISLPVSQGAITKGKVALSASLYAAAVGDVLWLRRFSSRLQHTDGSPRLPATFGSSADFLT